MTHDLIDRQELKEQLHRLQLILSKALVDDGALNEALRENRMGSLKTLSDVMLIIDLAPRMGGNE